MNGPHCGSFSDRAAIFCPTFRLCLIVTDRFHFMSLDRSSLHEPGRIQLVQKAGYQPPQNTIEKKKTMFNSGNDNDDDNDGKDNHDTDDEDDDEENLGKGKQLQLQFS